jgi:hypothetical protein
VRASFYPNFLPSGLVAPKIRASMRACAPKIPSGEAARFESCTAHFAMSCHVVWLNHPLRRMR